MQHALSMHCSTTDCIAYLFQYPSKNKKLINPCGGRGEEEFLPYGGLFIKAESGLANLTRSGLIKGDRLILQVEDPGIFLILFWACLMGGIIPIPLSLATTDEYRLKLLKVWDILGNAPIAFDENISADFHTYLKEQGKANLRDQVEENSLFPKGFDPDLGEIFQSIYSIIKFLGNLFKFKAETIFNRRNIQHILRIKNFFQRRSWAN